MGFLAQVSNSRYLKKEDALPTAMLLTITGAKRENVAPQGEREKVKVVLYFAETEKGFVLGSVTAGQIASFLGDPGETPEKWFGQKIVLFCDPTVMMGPKQVGGLRVRAPRNQGATGQQQNTATSWQQAQPNTIAPNPVAPGNEDY